MPPLHRPRVLKRYSNSDDNVQRFPQLDNSIDPARDITQLPRDRDLVDSTDLPRLQSVGRCKSLARSVVASFHTAVRRAGLDQCHGGKRVDNRILYPVPGRSP
jgi:hypothetical protein